MTEKILQDGTPTEVAFSTGAALIYPNGMGIQKVSARDGVIPLKEGNEKGAISLPNLASQNRG